MRSTLTDCLRPSALKIHDAVSNCDSWLSSEAKTNFLKLCPCVSRVWREWQESEGGRSLTQDICRPSQDILSFHNPSFLEDRTLLLYGLVVCKAPSNNWMCQELFKNKIPLICISNHSSGHKSQFSGLLDWLNVVNVKYLRLKCDGHYCWWMASVRL